MLFSNKFSARSYTFHRFVGSRNDDHFLLKNVRKKFPAELGPNQPCFQPFFTVADPHIPLTIEGENFYKNKIFHFTHDVGPLHGHQKSFFEASSSLNFSDSR